MHILDIGNGDLKEDDSEGRGALVQELLFSFLLEMKASQQCGPACQQPLAIFLHQVSYIFLITSAKSYQFI